MMKHMITACAVVALISSAAMAAPLYTETFDNASGTNQDPSYTGWSVYATSLASAASSTAPQPNAATNGSGFLNSFWGSSGDSGVTGDEYPGSDADKIYLWSTTEAAGINVAGITDIDFTFRSNFTSGSGWSVNFHPAVLIDGQWYVNGDAATTTSSSNTFESYNLAFDVAAANWQELSFSAGSSMALGSTTASDLSGTLQGAGVFVTMPGTTASNPAIDNYTITPEPATMSLLGLGGLALLRRRRN